MKSSSRRKSGRKEGEKNIKSEAVVKKRKREGRKEVREEGRKLHAAFLFPPPGLKTPHGTSSVLVPWEAASPSHLDRSIKHKNSGTAQAPQQGGR